MSIKVSATYSLLASLSLPKLNLQASPSLLHPIAMIIVVGYQNRKFCEQEKVGFCVIS